MATNKRSKVERYIQSMSYLRKVHSIYYWKAYYNAESLTQAYNMLRAIDPRVTKPYIPDKSTQEKPLNTIGAYTLNGGTPPLIKNKRGGYSYG
jgi:hypothetical protein|tara:strand:- start:75 stop:353 length:279 start_codon:yes stop_codon:yes gene_type:complete